MSVHDSVGQVDIAGRHVTPAVPSRAVSLH